MEEPLIWAFLRKLKVHELPSPELGLEEDGDLSFDWLDGNRDLSVSLSPSGRISWAALVGDYKARGSFQWPDWSPELDKAFVLFELPSERSSMTDLSSRCRAAADRLADAYPGSGKYSPVSEAVDRLREAATAVGIPAPPKPEHVWQLYARLAALRERLVLHEMRGCDRQWTGV